MITKSKQIWKIGETVKVGFLTLQIKDAVATPGDYLPDYYLLTDKKDRQYKFTPYNGLERI